MAKKSIKRFFALSKLSDQENKFRKEFAENYLEYLETLSFNKRVREIELLLYETEVKRVVTIDKRLSDQEKKCLLLASRGKNIQETAHILGLKFPTAREYRNSAIKKLKARNITAAVRLSLQYGLF